MFQLEVGEIKLLFTLCRGWQTPCDAKNCPPDAKLAAAGRAPTRLRDKRCGPRGARTRPAHGALGAPAEPGAVAGVRSPGHRERILCFCLDILTLVVTRPLRPQLRRRGNLASALEEPDLSKGNDSCGF